MIVRRPACALSVRDGATCSAFAHVGGFAAEEEVVARRCEEIDHLGVVAQAQSVIATMNSSRNNCTSPPPILLGLPPNRRSLRILKLKPIGRMARSITRS